MNLQISDNKETPLYHRIADAVVEGVASGRIAAGQKLPAHMELAKSLGVNPLTVSRGYGLLETRGIVRQRRGSGTYVQPDALRRVTNGGKQRIANLAVILGETSLARCQRETLFILIDMLDGVRDVLDDRETHVTYHQALVRGPLENLKEDDAVLLADPAGTDPTLVAELLRRRIPIVSVWDELLSASVPHVIYDRRQAAMLACQHLVDCGYKRIGFIGVMAHRDAPLSTKFYVYNSLLQAAGLDIYSRYVRNVTVEPGRAYAAARDIIQAGDIPEAFFVDTDYKAMEVICALNDAGLKVPDDVGVVSYDDIPESTTFTPPLTTVRVPRREIGRRGAKLLLDWPSHGPMPQSVVLNSELVVRASTSARKLAPVA